MSDKFPVGSFWRCRDGVKAIITFGYAGGLLAIREDKPKNTLGYLDNGKEYIHNESPHDLLEPWRERERGTVWVNIWKAGKYIHANARTTVEESLLDVEHPGSFELIASFKHNWTEGEYRKDEEL